MKKRSLPLSALLDNAVGDYNPTVNIKCFSKIAHVARKQEQACAVLRLQLLNKIKSHPFRFVASLEVYYCICLIEYLVVKVKGFYVYVTDNEFVKAIDKMAQLDKLVGFFKSKPTLVQLKTMNLIQLLRTYPQPELYEEMYKKYTKKGVTFPPLTVMVYDDDGVSVSEAPEDTHKVVQTSQDPIIARPPTIQNKLDEEFAYRHCPMFTDSTACSRSYRLSSRSCFRR